MIVLNVRHPRDFRGDLAAMIGSARIGERRLGQLLAEFGSATTHAAVAAVLDGAERQVRAIIAGWKDGVYEGEAFLDDDGHGAQDIHIRARVTKQGSDLEIDLTDSHPQVTGFINSSYANTHSAAVVALAYLIDPEIPEERRRLPAAEAEAQGGHRRLAEARRAGDAVHQPLRPGDHRGDHPRARTGMPRAGDGRLGPALPHGRAGRRPAHREALHLAPVPGASRWRRLVGGRRLAGCRRVAGGRRHQVRQHRGAGGALSPAFPPPRVSSRQRRRWPLPRRSRRRARARHRDGRARRRQHRRRRRQVRRLRPARRRGRQAASLLAAVGRPPRSGSQDQGDRHRAADPATCCTPTRAGAAAGASRSSARRRSAPGTSTLGFVSAEGR